MGIFDWLFKRKDSEPDESAERADKAKAAPRAKPAAAPKKTKTKKKKKSPKAPRTGKKRKAREAQAGDPVDATASKVEVLSVEEAERRYGALFNPDGEPVEPPGEPDPLPEVPEATPAVEAAPKPPPAPKPPRERGPPRPRRPSPEDEREATRAWAIVPQLEALLTRVDTLLARPELTASALRTAKKKLFADWDALGLPPRERMADLREARALRLKAMDARLKQLHKVADEEAQGLVAQRRELLERAAAAVQVEDLRAAREQLQVLDTEWRASPRLDAKHFRPLKAEWDGMWAAVNERSDAARAEKKAAYAQCLEQQEKLAATAEQLAEGPDPWKAAERIKTLQATWKTLGSSGRSKASQAVWERFRGAADRVFEKRNEAGKAEATANVEMKEALIAKALALAEEGVLDPEPVLDDLHRAWKKVGRVPRKQSDELWGRFREACNQLRTPPALPADVAGDDGGLRFNPFSVLGAKEE